MLLVGKGRLHSGLPAGRIFSSVLFQIRQAELSLDKAVVGSHSLACHYLQVQTQAILCQHNHPKNALKALPSPSSRLALQGMTRAGKGTWLVCTEAPFPLLSGQLKPLEVAINILCDEPHTQEAGEGHNVASPMIVY